MFSKRIKKIASLVDKGANVIDIGCDHGLLDIYLTIHNDNKCIAADISENALNSAIKNIKARKLNIKTIKSNGFENIQIKKDSICVIAGMGTSTITEILSNEKATKIGIYVIQTNNDYYELRKIMLKLGYYIEDEIAFKDKKIWYVIMKFKKGKRNYTDYELQIGPLLKKKTDSEIKEYFMYLLDKNTNILRSIPKKYILKRLKLIILINKINKIVTQKK